MANSDYGAIPLTLAESTSEALNTKLGVTTGFKPLEWPEAIASIPTGGGVTPVSLQNNYLIGVSATTEYQSPIDANNYIDASNDTVTLHRNAEDKHLFIYTPLVEVGRLYLMLWDSATNTDGNIYVQTASDVSTNPVTVNRIVSTNTTTPFVGYVFTPSADCYYGVAFWSNNKDNIVVKNPRLYDISSDISNNVSIEQVLTDGRISNRDYGTVNLDKNILGYDWAVVRVKKAGQTSTALFDLSKLDGTNYIQYTYRDLAVYISVRLSDSTLQCYDYGGSWDIIDADVSVFNGNLFDN